MEAIRSIQTVADGEVHLRLPKQFWGQKVEIIVLSSPKQETQPVTIRKKSARGSLKRYANPGLMEQEQNAWQTAADEKHAVR